MSLLHQNVSELISVSSNPIDEEIITQFKQQSYKVTHTGLHGSVYQLKLLMLFAWRGLKKGYEFRLATDMDAADKFDDVVFQYKKPLDSKIYSIFVQAKHTNDLLKTVMGHDLLNDRDDQFSLPKYLRSCQKIKKNPEFQNVEPQYVICTNVGLNFENGCSLKFRDKLLYFQKVSDDMLGECFKFNIDSTNSTLSILTDFFIKTSPFKKLALALAQHLSWKKQITSKNKLFRTYHVALKERVINIESNQFYQSFLNCDSANNQISSNLNAFRTEMRNALTLKNTFVQTTAIRFECSESSGKELHRSDPDLLWKNMTDSFILADDFKQLVKHSDSITSLPEQISEDDVKAFVTRLVFSVNQPDGTELYQSIEKEIKTEFPLIDAKIMTNNLALELLNWMEKTGKNNFLSEKDIKNFFKEVEYKIAQLKIHIFTAENVSKIKSVGLELVPFHFSKLYYFLNTVPTDGQNAQMFSLVTSQNETILGSLIVAQVLHQVSNYKNDGNYMFISQSNCLHLKKEIVKSLTQGAPLLVVECEKCDSNMFMLLLELLTIRNPHYKIVLISQKEDAIARYFETHYEIKDDFTFFNQLTVESKEKLLNKIVKFQGDKISLNELLNGSSNFSAIDSKTVAKLIHNEEIEIGQVLPKSVGYDIDYYVNRRLCLQKVIMRDILKDRSINDMFAISGLDKLHIHRLFTKDEKWCLFQNINVSDHVRVIILESQSAKSDMENVSSQTHHFRETRSEKSKESTEEQFEFLCKQYSGDEINIHLLKYESDVLIWQQSKGSITNLQKYLETNEGQAKLYSEMEILLKVNQQKIMIISDAAGMGKSTLITYLSGKMKQIHRHMWVVWIDLNLYTKQLEDLKNVSYNLFDSEKVINILSEKILDLKMPFEKNIFKECFHQEDRISVMFDGFDEISPYYEEAVMNLIQTLINTNVSSVWVTTRPHMRQTLEIKFKQFAYTLQPFSREDQQNFLISFWECKINKETTITVADSKWKEKLKLFSIELLKIVSNTITDNEKKFTGIPLQTRMLAEVYYEEAKQFIETAIEKPELTIELELFDLYDQFINKKIKIYFGEKAKDDITNPAVQERNKISKIEILNRHKYYALSLLLSEKDFELLLNEYKGNKLNTVDKAFINIDKRIGIIICSMNDKPQFIHRTFAEYFSAIFILNIFENGAKNVKILNFLLTDILLKSNYQVIRSFLNTRLINLESTTKNTLSQFGKCIYDLWTKNNKRLRCNNGDTIWHIAASAGNLNIIHFVLYSLDNYENNLNILNEINNLGNTAMQHAALKKRWDVVKWLVEEGASVNILDKYGKTVLHSAISSKRFDVVKLLVAKGAFVNFAYKDGPTPLYQAVCNGCLEIVTFLVENGASVNVNGKYLSSPLHQAAFRGKLDVVTFLEENGALVNAIDKDKEAPLHYAASKGNLDVVKLLVNKGSSVNVANNFGLTPLHKASANGMLDVVKLLVVIGASVNVADKDGETPLHQAAYWGKSDVVRFLKEKGTSVNVIDKDGETPLHKAASSGKLDVAKLLVVLGASVNVADKDGETPLHQAACSGKLDIITFLAEKSASVNVADKDGETPLHQAASRGKLNAVKLLIEKGASVNVAYKNGKTAINKVLESLKVWNNVKLNVIKLLLENGASVNVADKDGATPLHQAAYMEMLDVIKLLVEKGVSVDAADRDGEMPLHQAAYSGKLESVKLLVENGAFVNAQDNYGKTALHQAARRGKIEVVEFLIKNGANVNVEDSDGHTPLNRASLFGRMNVVKFFVEKGAQKRYEDETMPRH